MTTQVTLTRRATTPFAPRFVERHPDFWPIVRAARTFYDALDWPAVAEYVRAFDGPPPVTFVETLPKPRRSRARGSIDRASMYDAQIVSGVVPTRARCWHDFSNALVWATFPLAKRALHARQHRAIAAWIPEGATRLPGARSREMDALALLDEGGVVQVGARSVVFGHALYEGAALLLHENAAPVGGVRRVVAREILRLEPRASESESALLARVDAALRELIDEREPLTPESFPSARRLFCSNSGAAG